MKKNSTELLVDFKVALAAVISDEDYKSLEVQFLYKKKKAGRSRIHHHLLK